MIKLKKILFPVDFSERTAGAAHYVEALTGRFNAELTLLHVVESADYLYGALEFGGSALTDFNSGRLAHSREHLDAYLNDELGQFNVRRMLIEGDPARVIVQYAAQEAIDLIMMPSHGFGPFRRFVIGSVTAKVLHDAHVPVWTGIHMENAPPLDAIACRNVLCAIDLSPVQSEHALTWASVLAEEYGAKLTLVHATPEAESRPANYYESEIGKLQVKLGTSAEVCIEAGDPATVVHDVAEQREADILVIGRGSAAEGFGRLRTHAYPIIRHSPCPVVSV